MNELFSGLEHLGFKEIEISNLYGSNKDEKVEHTSKEAPKKTLTYQTTVTCPVCANIFKEKAVKSSSFRVASKDTDFFIRYEIINPYFYDVWICNKCGYSALKVDFPKLRENEAKLVLQNITPKFKSKEFPEDYDISIAIERYKMALINAVYTEAKASKKAMICLKIAWMYRLLGSENSKETERNFLKEALTGFEQAYMKEIFPIYGMDSHIMMYLIGELNRRLSKYSIALNWLSKLITSKGVKPNLKELARTQKDLIKDELMLQKKVELNGELLNTENMNLEVDDETSTEVKQVLNNKKSFLNLFKKTN